MFLISYLKSSICSGVVLLTNCCVVGILSKWENTTSRIVQMTSYSLDFSPGFCFPSFAKLIKQQLEGTVNLPYVLLAYFLHIYFISTFQNEKIGQ